MRWSLIGVMVGVAFACAWLALGGWLLDRTVLNPSISGDEAAAVFADQLVRDEFAGVVTTATAGGMHPGDPNAAARVAATVDLVLTIPEGAEFAAPTLVGIHERLIGAAEGPLLIDPVALAQIVRDERAGGLAPASITVERIAALEITDRVVGTLVPIAAIATAVLLALVALTRPDRDVLARTAGFALLIGALTVVLFRYVVPAFVTPALDDSTWAHVPSLAAQARLRGTLALSALLAVVGGALLFVAGRMGRSRRWSTPVSTYRYREQHRWS